MQKGFTLIEILVAVALVGILAAVSLITINPLDQLKKSTDAQRKSDLAQLQRGLDLYYDDNGRYPASSVDFKMIINASAINWGSAWQPYMNKLPKDPNPSRTYQYYSPASSVGQSYYIYASLERGSRDPQACNKGNACISITTGGAGFPTSNSCGGTCNYAITSANVAP